MPIKPLFLLSLPRSGSTITQRVLGAHGRIATAREPWVLLPMLALDPPRALGAKLRLWPWSELPAKVGTFADGLPGGHERYRRELHDFALRLYSESAEGEATYFLDKSPVYTLAVDELMRVFPEAKFVFLWRNPLASLVSMLERQAPNGGWEVHRFARLQAANLSRLVSAYERHPNAIGVRYEDLMTRTEAWAPLMDYLELPLEEGMLDRPITLAPGDGLDLKTSGPALKDASLARWREVIDNPIRRAWCRRYLQQIGAERLRTMGYRLDDLLADLDATAGSGWAGSGADAVTLLRALARELTLARIPPHAGSPSCWRMLLAPRDGALSAAPRQRRRPRQQRAA